MSKHNIKSLPSRKKFSNNKRALLEAFSSKLFLSLLAIFLVTCTSYYNAYDGQFCFDDQFAILNNPDAQGKTSIWDIWRHDYWGQDIQILDSHKSYRPITVISFRIQYWIHHVLFGTTDSNDYWLLVQLHIGNILLHAVASCLVFSVARATLNISYEASLGAGILFATHPIHTEAVSNIVGRTEMVSAIFGLLAFLVYVSADGTLEHCFKRTVMAMALVWCAILSKETAFALFPIFLWWDVLYTFQNSQRKAVRKNGLYLRIALLFVGVLLYLYARKAITVHFTVSNYRRAENPIAFSNSTLERWLSTLYLHGRYMMALIKPWPLSCDWSYNCIPLIHTLWDSRNYLWVSLYLSIFAVFSIAVYWYLHGHSNGFILLFLIGFAGASFFPASNVLLFVGTMLAERVLYLPSIAFCILVAYIVHWIAKRVSSSWLYYSVLFITTSMYIMITLERNLDWRNDEALFESAYHVCPDSVKVLFNLAVLRDKQNQFNEAKQLLHRIREIDPSYCEVDFEFGLLEFKENANVQRTIHYLKKAVQCIYTRAKALENLQKIYNALIQGDDSKKSVRLLEEWADILATVEEPIAIEVSINQYHTAAERYRELGHLKDEIRCIKKAYRLDPENSMTTKLLKNTKGLAKRF